MVNYYKVLGVSREASYEEIKKAYRRKAKEHHPDVSSSGSAHKEFALINEAYSVLADPDKKRKYDLRLAYGDFFISSKHHHKTPPQEKQDDRKYGTHKKQAQGDFHFQGRNQFNREGFDRTNPYQYKGHNFSPFIYNMFFASGMFVGFLIVFLTIAFVYVRMWPFVFLLVTIPGFILIREGWRGIARINPKKKKKK